MKKIIVFVMSLFVIGNIAAQENKVKTYKIKSGYVKYKSLDKHTTGTHEIWWDDYGSSIREVYNTVNTTKFFGKKKVSKKHTVTITKGKFIWQADLETKTGTQGINPMYDFVQDNMGNMSESEQEQTAKSLLEGLGGSTEKGTEEVMGYTCDVTTVLGSKVWMYKGVALKSESKMLGLKSGEEAVEFKPDMKVSASMFKPLDDIEYEKSPSLDEMLSQMDEEDDMLSQMDEEDKPVPLTYPFDKFKAQMKKYAPEGYLVMGPMNLMNQSMYTCAWMKGQADMVGISAMSLKSAKDFNPNELSGKKGVKTFKHRGKTCHYIIPQEMEDFEKERESESAPVLIVIYKKYDMMVLVAAKPDKSKDELIEILDNFKF